MGKTLIQAFFIENIVTLDRQLSWSVLCISECLIVVESQISNVAAPS